MPEVSFHNVTLSGRDVPRLQDVSLNILPGITAVMGASGAGKTSMLNLIVGYETPDAGEMAVRSDVAWVPSGLGLWPGYTVRQHLEAVTDESPLKLIEALGMGEQLEARPDALSLGQQTRLAVARALASSASLLVMDEPLAHLDPRRRPDFWRVICEWLGQRSLVFSSHEPETVLSQATNVCCLIGGRMEYFGDVIALYEAPETEELAQFLGRANWIGEAEDRVRWLGETARNSGPCFRPEFMDLSAKEDGALVFVASQTYGLYMESRLRHASTGDERSVLHRPSAIPDDSGWRCALHWLGLFLVCFLLVGCGSSTELPTLSVTEVKAWRLPIDGPKLPAPRSVAVGPEDEVVVLDDAGRVLVFDVHGKMQRRWSMPDVSVGRPEGVVVFDDGHIVVCNTHYHQIVTFDPEGNVVRTFGKSGRGAGEFIYPVAITKDPQEHLYVGEYGSNDRIQKFTRKGEHILTFGSFGTGPGEFQRPSGIAWHEGLVYVVDAVNNRLQVFQDDGTFVKILPVSYESENVALHLPYDLVLDSQGDLILIEYGAGRILKLTREGELLGAYGRQGSAIGQFLTPWGITVDSKGRLRVADQGNRRLMAIQ